MIKRVVVTGFGIVSPLGNNANAFFSNLISKKSGLQFAIELQQAGTKCCVAGIPRLLDSDSSIIELYSSERYSTCLQYALLAAVQACNMSGIPISSSFDTIENQRLGIITGSLSGPTDSFIDYYENFYLKNKIHKYRTSVGETIMNSGVSTFISGITGAAAFVLSTSNACASGTEAIVLGYDSVKLGKATQAIVGGYEATSILSWSLYDSMRVLGSDSNHLPEKSSRPMNENVNGFIPAAGAGILILEEMEHAVSRGATIYAEIVGGSINNGAQRNGGTMSAPNCDATVRCIQDAIADADIDMGEIDYLCGHLTSTMADVLEIKNWAKALNRYGTEFPLINSIKGMTGHCIGAAGAIETIAAILQMKESLVHPNVNCEPIHPEILKIIDKKCIPLEPTIKEIKYCAKLSLGFGDANACLVLKKT